MSSVVTNMIKTFGVSRFEGVTTSSEQCVRICRRQNGRLFTAFLTCFFKGNWIFYFLLFDCCVLSCSQRLTHTHFQTCRPHTNTHTHTQRQLQLFLSLSCQRRPPSITLRTRELLSYFSSSCGCFLSPTLLQPFKPCLSFSLSLPPSFSPCYSISLAQCHSLSVWNVSHQLEVMCCLWRPVTACPIREGFFINFNTLSYDKQNDFLWKKKRRRKTVQIQGQTTNTLFIPVPVKFQSELHSLWRW